MKRFLFAVEADSSRMCGRRWSISDKMTPENIENLRSRCQQEVGDDFVILDSAKRPEFFAQRSEGAIGSHEAISEESHFHEPYWSKRSRSVFLWPRTKTESTKGTAHTEQSGAEVDHD